MDLEIVFDIYQDEAYGFTYGFTMTEEQLKTFPMLQKCYDISLILTKDITEQTNGCGIAKRKIWKGYRITDKYDMEYTEMAHPTTIEIPENNEKYIQDNMPLFEKMHIKGNNDLTYLMPTLMKIELDNIELELRDMEKYYYPAKKHSLYLKKVVPDDFPHDAYCLIFEKLT